MRFLIEARNVTLAVDDGVIAPPGGRYDAVFRAPDCQLRPGLINAHDHLHRNHYGRLGRPPYPNAYAWARDIQERYRDTIAAGRTLPRRTALLAGAWKNLRAGVTRIVHHDRWERDFESAFPLRVLPLESRDSLGMDESLDGLELSRPHAIHGAEGIDPAAADEVRTLDRLGLLTDRLLLVHAVGADADGIARIRAAGTAVIWCPTSNLFLFGRTAPAELLGSEIDVLIGSDSRLTADGDLLDELRAARALGILDERRLEDAVGTTAARRLAAAPPSLAPGTAADLVLLARPLLAASAEDVRLVFADGHLRVADPALCAEWDPAGAGGRLDLDGAVRWLFGD